MERRPSKNVATRNIQLEKRNLVHVCRLAVKSLVESGCYHTIDENSDEMQNFLNIMECIFSHRLKGYQTWYGTEETRYFWDYIRAACHMVPHNCLASIRSLENPRTGGGKGRAWLRQVLMEKRLSEYMGAAIQQAKLTRRFYLDGSLMLSDDVNELCGLLLGLNAIDFSFDIRSENLDYATTPVIDYSAYLRYDHCDSTEELEGIGDSDNNGNPSHLETRYSELEAQHKITCEQKGYLEELVRLRESQIEEFQSQHQRLIDTLTHYELESKRERQQLEAVIIELQAQLHHAKEDHRYEVQKLQTLLARCQNTPPAIALSDLQSSEDERLGPMEPDPRLTPRLSSSSTLPPSPLPASADARSLGSLDAKSIMSGASVGSVLLKEDTQSMIVLTGSLGSQSSKISGETQSVSTGGAGLLGVEQSASSGLSGAEQSRNVQAIGGAQSCCAGDAPPTAAILEVHAINSDIQRTGPSDIKFAGDVVDGEQYKPVASPAANEKRADVSGDGESATQDPGDRNKQSRDQSSTNQTAGDDHEQSGDHISSDQHQAGESD